MACSTTVGRVNFWNGSNNQDFQRVLIGVDLTSFSPVSLFETGQTNDHLI